MRNNAPTASAFRVRNKRDEGRSGILVSDDIWQHSKTSSDGMRLRVTIPADRAHTKRAISRQDWEKQLSLSRQLYARVPEISGAMLQKSLYVIGDAWLPRFVGKSTSKRDSVWGDEAESILCDFFCSCDMRGEPYDFQTALFLDSLALDRDADSLMVTVNQEDGPPKLAFYPANRIASRYDWGQDSAGYGRVPVGKFKGAKVYNGVIFSNQGQQIGVNVMGESFEKDIQLSLIYDPNSGLYPEAQLLYEPEWHDQGRGIPRVVNAMLQWMDYEDIHYFLKRQVKQDSAQGILHYNEEGAAEDSKSFIESRTVSGTELDDVKFEHLEGNEIMYFKAMGGGKLEPYRTDRPHPNIDNYTMRVLRGAMQPLGWFYELYDPSKVGGASTRLIQDMARASVASRQKTIRKRALRAAMIRLSWAIEHKELPPIEGWENWAFTLPARLTVDARYDEKTWSERIKMGTGNYAGYYGEKGQWWEDEVDQRIKEQAWIEAKCKEHGVDPNKVQMLTPNGNPSGNEDAEKEKEETE